MLTVVETSVCVVVSVFVVVSLFVVMSVSVVVSTLCGTKVVPKEVDMSTLKFWPLLLFVRSSPILMGNVDHLPSLPSQSPLGLRT